MNSAIHYSTLGFNANVLFEWLHFGLHPSQPGSKKKRSDLILIAMIIERFFTASLNSLNVL